MTTTDNFIAHAPDAVHQPAPIELWLAAQNAPKRSRSASKNSGPEPATGSPR